VNGASPLRPLLESAGARWLELPVLYPADPFLETAGEDIRRRMFVTEGQSGERLALRPDFTIPVCLEHLKSGAGAARYAYEGVVFRRHDGGAPERREAGFEDIGAADRAAADADIVALAVSAVAAVAPSPLAVRLGDIGLFSALLSALGLPDAWRRRLRRSFGLNDRMEANLARLSRRNRGYDGPLDETLRAAAEAHDGEALRTALAERMAEQGRGEAGGRSAAEIAERFLDQRALAEAEIGKAALGTLRLFLGLSCGLDEAAPKLRDFCDWQGIDLGPALELFAARVEAIAARAPAAAIRFEAAFGRPLDYYTGLVFDVRSDAVAFPLAGGGRYDRLFEMLGAGAPLAAVGFTMRLDLPAAAPS
jgi:ATP phosphoribosyltransferase regulatory subunit